MTLRFFLADYYHKTSSEDGTTALYLLQFDRIIVLKLANSSWNTRMTARIICVQHLRC